MADCSSTTAQVFRFDDLKLDLEALELRRAGEKVRLEGQPLRILALLVQRPGQLVTREDLRRRLWPGNTIVDFDQSINAAVKRLREALDDSAETPRYIETLPRRGYRFIRPVEAAPANLAARQRGKQARAWQLALPGLALVLAVLLGAGVSSCESAWRRMETRAVSTPRRTKLTCWAARIS